MELETQEKQEKKIQQPNLFIRLVPSLLDCFVVLIWGALTIYIIGKMLNIIKLNPGVNFEGVLGVYAAVTGVAMTIINYHRGSSRSSENKQDTINDLIKINNAP